MKHFVFFVLAVVAAAGTASAAGDRDTAFDRLYAASDSLSARISRLIYNGPVTPIWKDGQSFFYTTAEATGRVTYEVTVTPSGVVKREASRAELDSMTQRRPVRPQGGFQGGPAGGMTPGQGVSGRPSPDGKWTAFVRDNNVWLAEADGSNAVQLSFDGNEHDRYRQVMWSPDSRKLAAMRRTVVEERQILLRESRPADKVQPGYRWLDYAKPGDEVAQSTPVLFDVATRSAVPFDTSPFRNQYELRFGQWSPHSDYFTFEYNQRGHQLYQLVAVDAVTGTPRIIAEEKSSTFVYYNDLYRHYFRDGKRILWISERDDWRHLYMVDALTGSCRQLTRGAWNVRDILRVDEENGEIMMYVNGLHAASGEDPYNKHLVRLDMASGRITDLTPENAFHDVTFSPDRALFVDNYSRPDLPTVSVLRRTSDGEVLAGLQKTDLSALVKATGYTLPEVFHAKGRDGVTDIWGTIYLPCRFNPSKKYKVVEYIYAGPHDSHVEKTFMTAMPRFGRLLELGFVVVTIDGMGTDNRSKSFQDVAWRNLKDAGFEDRILWIKEAASKRKYMDIGKVGIYGYSAGGQNALSALLFHPEFYKVAVALCGCHDNRMDKIWWNEQWMGWPVGPWYAENSNVDNAWRLEGDLFIINGEMDDNVDPASTLQVVSELVKHNKQFDQLYLPGHSHNLGSAYITRRVFKFFWDHCF